MKDTTDIGIMRPAICPECGYSLNMLPAEGACPECGWRFGGAEVVLYVWGESASAARSRRGLWILTGCVVFVVLMQVWQLAADATGYLPGFRLLRVVFADYRFWVGAMVMSVFWGILMWPVVARRRKNLRMMTAPVQLRLSREGFATKEGIGRVKVQPWGKVWVFEFFKKKDGRQRIRIRWGGRWGPSFEFDTDLGNEEAGRIWRRVEEWRARSGEK